MIELSNGYLLEFQCASGALGFDGKGWWWEQPLRWLGIIEPRELTIVSKTFSLEPIKGNLSMFYPWTCVRLLKDGVVNAVGLTNPGAHIWKSKYYSKAINMDYHIAASIEVNSPETALELGTILNDCQLPFIELNVSCPNIGKKSPEEKINQIVYALKEKTNIPIILKLSFLQTQDIKLIESIGDNHHIEAVHVINSIPWNVIYHNKTSPIEKYTKSIGGVSGPIIKKYALQALINMKSIIPKKPVVAGGGIYTKNDVQEFQDKGADAISFGTVFLRKPWMPNRIIRQCRNYPKHF